MSEIGRQLGMTKQNVRRITLKLEALGYIERDKSKDGKSLRTSCVIYRMTEEGKEYLKSIKRQHFSVPVKEKKFRSHLIRVKYPIIRDNPDAKWPKASKKNNWTSKSELLSYPVGMTIQKTTKHIVIYFHKFYSKPTEFANGFMSHILRGTMYAHDWLQKKKGIHFDPFEGQIISQHIAAESPELDDVAPKSATAEIGLGRKARGIFPTTFDGKAWLDRSNGPVDIESNDMEYAFDLLRMPDRVAKIEKTFLPAIQDLTVQIQKHLSVQESQERAMVQLTAGLAKMTGAIVELQNTVKELKS